MSAPCTHCNCPADFEWLPCTEVHCRQGERIMRLRSSDDYIPLPPLPESDDENEATAPESDDWERESDDWERELANIQKPLYVLIDPSPWSEAYAKSLGHLANFPHMMQEADYIYAILGNCPIDFDELIEWLRSVDRPPSVFARSLEASVRFHLAKMEEIGIIVLV